MEISQPISLYWPIKHSSGDSHWKCSFGVTGLDGDRLDQFNALGEPDESGGCVARKRTDCLDRGFDLAGLLPLDGRSAELDVEVGANYLQIDRR